MLCLRSEPSCWPSRRPWRGRASSQQRRQLISGAMGLSTVENPQHGGQVGLALSYRAGRVCLLSVCEGPSITEGKCCLQGGRTSRGSISREI